MPIQTPICDFSQMAHDFKLKSTENKFITLDDIKGVKWNISDVHM